MEDSFLNEIMKLLPAQGVWAFLFVGLFIYVMKEHAKREVQWVDMVNKLSTIIDGTLKNLSEDVQNLLKKGDSK